MRTSDFHPLSKLQSYSTILSTTVIMLYIRSSDFIHLIAESLYAFTNFSLFPHHPAPGNYYSAFCFSEFDFLKKFYIWVTPYSIDICLSLLISLSKMPSRSMLLQIAGFPSFWWLNSILLCVYMWKSSLSIHPTMDNRLFPYLTTMNIGVQISLQ